MTDVEHILQYFEYHHLPPGALMEISKECHDFAQLMVADLPDHCPEVLAGLRNLLQAKDCFVRAALDI